MWVQSLGWEDLLEWAMVTRSSNLVWRIPRTEEPGGLQSVGWQRVGHDWSDSARTPSVHRPQWLSGKEPACIAGDLCLIPGSGRCPGGGNGNPLQCSFWENPKDRVAWKATVHGVAESGSTEHTCKLKKQGENNPIDCKFFYGPQMHQIKPFHFWGS